MDEVYMKGASEWDPTVCRFKGMITIFIKFPFDALHLVALVHKMEY